MFRFELAAQLAVSLKNRWVELGGVGTNMALTVVVAHGPDLWVVWFDPGQVPLAAALRTVRMLTVVSGADTAAVLRDSYHVDVYDFTDHELRWLHEADNLQAAFAAGDPRIVEALGVTWGDATGNIVEQMLPYQTPGRLLRWLEPISYEPGSTWAQTLSDGFAAPARSGQSTRSTEFLRFVEGLRDAGCMVASTTTDPRPRSLPTGLTALPPYHHN